MENLLNKPNNLEEFLPKPPHICPYCNKELPFVPKAARKCPFCSQKFYVRRTVQSPQREIMTEQRAKEIEAEWEKHNNQQTFDDLSSTYSEYITKTDIENIHNQLSQKFGKKPLLNDLKWAIYNYLLQKMMSKNDLQSLSHIYFDMAWQCFNEDKSFFHLLQESKKMQLMYWKNDPYNTVKKVEISATSACPNCQNINGKIFTIKEALEKMPIPYNNCANRDEESAEKNEPGFCRCTYLPIAED